MWITQYKDKSPPSSRPSSRGIPPDIFEEFLALDEIEGNKEDEYQAYCQALPVQSQDFPHNTVTLIVEIRHQYRLYS